MNQKGADRPITVGRQEIEPPVEMFNFIRSMVTESDSRYDRSTFSFAKHPRMPIIPAPEGGGSKDLS